MSWLVYILVFSLNKKIIKYSDFGATLPHFKQYIAYFFISLSLAFPVYPVATGTVYRSNSSEGSGQVITWYTEPFSLGQTR